MKESNITKCVALGCLATTFLFVGCNNSKQNDTSKVEYIKIKEDHHLQKDLKSPTCKMTFDYGYLTENSNNDSVAVTINRIVAEKLLGAQYANLNPQTAVDSFRNNYITTYNNEVGELYMQDMKNNPSERGLPAWYNYEYSLTSTFSDGKEGVLNVKALKFEYTGGAHPNEWGTWLNFNANDGQLLTPDKVFVKGSDKAIAKLLIDALVKNMALKYSGEKVETIEDLQNLGILSGNEMYVSDNFILGKNDVSFLYNKYDIAPYSTGMIILNLPYSEIEKYMIIK